MLLGTNYQFSAVIHYINYQTHIITIFTSLKLVSGTNALFSSQVLFV